VLIVEPPNPVGGVKTLIKKICSALKMENLRLISCESNNSITPSPILNHHLNDILRYLSRINFYDAILYFGSIVGLGHIFDRFRNVPVIVFISGHPIYEFINTIYKTTSPFKAKIGGLINLGYSKLTYLVNAADLWVCHTLTVCEEIGVIGHDNYVLLKQFVLPFEIAYYNGVMESMTDLIDAKSSKHVQVFSYLSYADLPGLKLEALIRIFNCVRKHVNRNIRFIIEDPKARGTIQVNDSICIIGRMPWGSFLNTLATSDLYVETTIDEELRLTSLDAALSGVPIAKITAPAFFNRQDYTEDEVITAQSVSEFINIMVEYVNKIDYYKPYYSRNVYNFVVNKRTWGVVKDHFMTTLLSLMK